MTRRILAPLFAGFVAIAGCGGGGSSSPAPSTPIVTQTPSNPVVNPTTPPPSNGVPTPTPTPAACTASVNSNGRLALKGMSGSTVSNRLFVTYRTTARNVSSIERSAGAQQGIDFGQAGSNARILTVANSADVNAVAASLRKNADVVSVAPTHLRTLASDSVANDQYLDNVDQWYLYKTAVDPGAWAITHGSGAISVAVIDTGVDETNPDFVFDVKESVIAGIKVTGAGSVQDTNGHGTNTSGLATAQTNNSYGFAGVGWSTHLQSYKIFPNATAQSDCQTADTGDEAVAINDAVTNGASVISLSLGSPQSEEPGGDTAERTAIANAISHNVVVVAAAGNDYPKSTGQSPDYPAAYPGVIAVGASAVTDSQMDSYGSITAETVASYSNSGPTLVAPGGDASGDDLSSNNPDILHWIEGYSTKTAAYAPDQCTVVNNVCRVLFNGTSQATPQVAGAVALMEAYHGGARSLTPAQASAILTSTVDVLPGISATRQGAGRLNVMKAVTAAHP